MRRVILLCGVVLSGCASAPPLDVAAVPSAVSANSLAIEHCRAASLNDPPPTARAYIGCLVAANRALFVQIKLSRMQLVDNYTQRSNLLIDEYEGGQFTPQVLFQRHSEAFDELVSAAIALKSANDAEQQRAALKAALLAGALQGVGRAYQAQPAPIQCTAMQIGRVTSTSCQ